MRRSDMEKNTQLTLLLENRAGALAEVARVLAGAKVNIEAISISDGVHHGVLKLVTRDLKAARQALRDSGIGFSEQRVYSLKLANRPGALAEACTRLAEQGISLDFVYGSTCSCADAGCTCGCEGRLTVSLADSSEARALLKKEARGIDTRSPRKAKERKERVKKKEKGEKGEKKSRKSK
jgi:hypothetical protein